MFYVIFCIAYSIVHYLNVLFSGLITSVKGRELAFLLSISRNLAVSVRRNFFFLWELRISCVSLMWQSLDLSYNY